jgi:hypothetical protein
MKILNAHEVKEPGYYWHIPQVGDGWPVLVSRYGERLASLKPGETVAEPLAGMYIGPLTTAAIQGI